MSIVSGATSGDISTWEYTDQDLLHDVTPWDGSSAETSAFDTELQRRWDAAMAAGAFRYGMQNVLTRVIAGPRGYVGQLNEKRATERRKPQDITSVKQPHDPAKFNFTRCGPGEIIFDIRKVGNKSSQQDRECEKLRDGGINDGSEGDDITHRLIVNVSPMSDRHCLLVPQINEKRPQVLTLTSLKVAIETLLLCRHRGARLGMNSLCGFASVNHLHYHFYYLDYELIVDHCPVEHLAGPYFEFTALPCPGFAMQLQGSTVDGLARAAHAISSHLHTNEIAHNVFMCRGLVFNDKPDSKRTTVRLFIWPRKKFIRGDTSSDLFNVAFCELAGHLPIKQEAGYYTVTEPEVDGILETALLPADKYREIRDVVVKMGGGDALLPPEASKPGEH